MTNPCYYCELPKPHSCAVCIHGDADADDLRKTQDKAEALERENESLKSMLERAIKREAELVSEKAELIGKLQDIVNGDARKTKKLEKCAHGKYGYEECENCIVEFAQSAIDDSTQTAKAAAHQEGGEG